MSLKNNHLDYNQIRQEKKDVQRKKICSPRIIFLPFSLIYFYLAIQLRIKYCFDYDQKISDRFLFAKYYQIIKNSTLCCGIGSLPTLFYGPYFACLAILSRVKFHRDFCTWKSFLKHRNFLYVLYFIEDMITQWFQSFSKIYLLYLKRYFGDLRFSLFNKRC